MSIRSHWKSQRRGTGARRWLQFPPHTFTGQDLLRRSERPPGSIRVTRPVRLYGLGPSNALFTGSRCGRIFLPIASHNATLEYLTTTKIGEKGQLTIPKQFRDELGLGNGAPFAVLRLGDGLILLPEQQRFEQLCKRVSARLTGSGLTPDDLISTLPEARNRVYARLYGKKPSSGANRRRPRSHRGK